MRKWHPLFICLLILVAIRSLAAQERRPVIGLALSGGGAKGLAHVGVIEELEAAGIYPDVVSGTSMGSIVGGLYAVGYAPDELRRIAERIEWPDYFTDTYPSSDVPIEQRRLSRGYQLSFPVDSNGLVLPRGLLRGRKIQTLLSLLFSPARHAANFDDFHLPFRAVATDIEDGSAYVFRDGPAQQAVRASMAIPSVFAPITVTDPDGNEHLLVDGLVVRNLPVQETIDLGADFVIAVDVGAPLSKKEELNNLIGILQQTADFGSISLNVKQRELADFVIDPDLGTYSAISYGATDSIVALGAETTRKILPDLKKQLLTAGVSLPMPPRKRETLQGDSLKLTGVRFECEDASAAVILRKLFDLRIPGRVTNAQLEDQVSKLYGSGFFDLLDFNFLPATEGNILIVSAIPAPDWQTRLSLAYDSDYEIGLRVNLTGRNVLGNGSLLGLDARISEFPFLGFEYLLYTQSRPSIGVRLAGNANYYPGRRYADGELLDEFRVHDFRSRLGIFSGLGQNRYVEIGLISENVSTGNRFISLQPTNDILSRRALYLEFIHDTYDREQFPRKGGRSRLYAQRTIGGRERSLGNAFRNLGSNLLITAEYRQQLPLGDRWSGSYELTGGFVQHQRRNYLNQLFLGRPLPGEPLFFNAFGKRHMEEAVSGFAAATLGLRCEIGRDNFVGLYYQEGRFARTEDELLLLESDALLNPARENRVLRGLGLAVGSITFAGPIRVNAEYDLTDGSANFNLHFGYYF